MISDLWADLQTKVIADHYVNLDPTTPGVKILLKEDNYKTLYLYCKYLSLINWMISK